MPVSKILHHHLSTPPIKEDHSSAKQGIVTILLHSEIENTKPASLRRTLSADMSSKKWLQQNGISSHMNKTDTFSSDNEERPGQDDIWKSIQSQKQNEPKDTSVWGSLILTSKSANINPYVHPLVKRASSLSEKSLNICTESLGSETGSDILASYPASEVSDEEKEEHTEIVNVKASNPVDEIQVAKYKASPPRPFPPPIPSIARGEGAAAVHMHSRRENGRLVLEAVSVTSRNYFQAHRQGGRLVLTIADSEDGVEEEKKYDEVEKVDEIEEVGEIEEKTDYGYGFGFTEEIEGKNVVKEVEIFKMEQNPRSGVISVNKTGLVMKKVIATSNTNPGWSKKLVEHNMKDVDAEEELTVPLSGPRVPRLIPTPPPPAAASFNVYDYFWRNKNTMSGSFMNPIIATANSAPFKNNYNKTNDQDFVIVRTNKQEDFAPYLRACKDGRRSFLIWEPKCIATS